MNCIWYGVLFQWINRFGGRLSALEKKVEDLERYVIIDITELQEEE